MWKLLPFTLKNLLRNRRRTILTVLSMAASLFLLGTLLSVYAAFYHRETTEGQALRLITRHRVSLTQFLPAFYGDKMRAIEGVEAVCAESWFGGTYIDTRPEHMFSRFAVEPDKLFKVYPDFTMPPEQLEAFKNDRRAIAVGAPIAERVGLKLGDRVTFKGDIFPVDLELTVRAIFHGIDAEATFFHFDYLNEGLPEAFRDAVGFYTIRTRSVDDVDRVAADIDAMFRNATEPTKTETEAAFTLAFINQIGNIKLFLLSIAGAIVFTIVLVSGNTMAMTVRERIREVGVLKTLGFPANRLMSMIVLESTAMAALGGLIGVGAAYLVTQLLANMLIFFVSGLTLPLWGVPICLAVAILIGFLSSVFPALSASRTRITDALRHTG